MEVWIVFVYGCLFLHLRTTHLHNLLRGLYPGLFIAHHLQFKTIKLKQLLQIKAGPATKRNGKVHRSNHKQAIHLPA